MPSSLVEGDTLLAIDVGASTTRALLFDVVEGRYRFIAGGAAPTTVEAPLKDISEGVRQAIEHLQVITGRMFLDGERRLVTPVTPEGHGVDGLVATLSAGPAVRTAVIGLLADISMDSAGRLARSTYVRIGETFHMNDGRRTDAQIDALIRLRPDLVILSGGTDGGASRSVMKMAETVGLACHLMPSDRRPAILFAGNQKLAGEVSGTLEPHAMAMHISPNLRPSLEVEDLEPARLELARMVVQVRKRQFKGVDELEAWAGGHILPSAFGHGRMMRFLSQVYGPAKGLLSVDLGASGATLAAGFHGHLTLGVYPEFGLGEGLSGLLNHTSLDQITRWLALNIADADVRDYLFHKALYPNTIPATKEDQAIEQALARQCLRLAVEAIHRDFPASAKGPGGGLLPYFEPALASGGILTGTPTLGQSLLLLLDALQPTGVTTLILDQNNLLGVLGAAAGRNNLMPVHVLESGAFVNLATVVSPAASLQYGTPVVRARLAYDNSNESKAEVKSGALEILPLAPGQTARLSLEPFHRADVGFGPGRKGVVRVAGSALGVVIDARGRPLPLPEDPVRRRDLIKKWLWTVGG